MAASVMPPPPPATRAGRPGPRAVHAAVLASLIAHGLVLGMAYKAWQGSGPRPSVGRQQGALQVSFRREQAPAAKPATTTPERAEASAAPRKQRPRSPKPSAEPRPARPAAATPAIAPATTAAPPPAERRPGARFASLFAPIVHAPLGNGSWTSRRAPVAPPPPDPAQLRAQALMALHGALQTRLARLGDELRTNAAALACELSIDTEQRTAALDCGDAQQQSLVWTHLQGLVVAGAVAPHAERLCLRLSGPQVAGMDCPEPFSP